VTNETTNGEGNFYRTWTIVSGDRAVKATCRGVAFTGTFSVKKKGNMANTGVPVVPTAGLGLTLTAVGLLLLRSTRQQRTRSTDQAR
jgi:hypothetical protein